MTEPVQAPKFEKHFWGPGNKGFDVLLQNYKVGLGASKELNEFIKERVSVEDGYVKGLAKLSRNVAAVPPSSLGSLAPLWKILHTLCDSLTAAHAQFITLLQDISREIAEYNIVQREKMKGNLKGEVDDAQDSLRVLETQETALQRAKKLYTQSVEQYVKQQKKMEKAKGETNPKAKQQVESRLKQVENWMETMKVDYKLAVEAHTHQVMGFQGNMLEACQKFESIEEEHLAQMITFVMKMSEAQETTHIKVGKAHETFNSKMTSNSVEKLLHAFVETKGTGKDKPVPEKFRPINERALATLVATSAHEDPRGRSPSTDSQKAFKPEKSIRQRIRFKKKGKDAKSAADSTGEHNGDHVISQPQETIPVGEVDEEGYSIRPQDAAAIRGFPDEDPTQDSDDSDFEDDFQSRVRQVQIRDQPQDLPKATVDDIRASVQTLKLGSQQYSPSTRIRKATSSQSLNNVLHTSPPLERKGLDNVSTSSLNPGMSSLLDSDIPRAAPRQSPNPVTSSLLDSDISLSSGVGMTTPLKPLLLAADPTEPLRPLAWSQEPPPLLPSPFTPPPTNSIASNSSSSSTPSPARPPENAERPVPKPRRSLSGKGDQFQVSSSSESPSKKNSLGELAQEGDVPLKVPPSGWTSSSDDESAIPPPTRPTFSIYDSPKSNTSSSSSDPDSQTPALPPTGGGGGGILTPPLPPNPRRNSRQRGTTSDTQSLSPLITSHVTATPPTTTALATTPTSLAQSLTPSTTSSSPSLTTSTAPSQNSTSAPPPGVPLAIAFQETCNAIFKSTDPSDCLLKITGEMVVSFPASLVGKVEKYGQLSFKLKSTEKLKQVLHNQILLTREGDTYGYYFNTPALSSHLTNMAGKKAAPFYNMQIIKYEVNITDGGSLPVRLAAYWKCTELITNFRFDYAYIGANLPSASRPPLTHMSVCVPVNGGVRNTLSRPSGNWLADKQQIMWKIGEVAAGDSDIVTSIHAKFDVTEGPSLPQPAEVKFICDGSTVSGVDLELMGTDYRVSLLKKKYSSGKYVAEMRY